MRKYIKGKAVILLATALIALAIGSNIRPWQGQHNNSGFYLPVAGYSVGVETVGHFSFFVAPIE